MRAATRFSQLLDLRVLQQYLRKAAGRNQHSIVFGIAVPNVLTFQEN
jgi:hypothetical protein